MHLSNSYYGHASILGRYTRLGEDPPPVWGVIQHGWNFGTGFSPYDPPAWRHRLLPAFLWSRRNVAAARARRWRRVVPIGAPFLYLRSMEAPVETSGEGSRSGTLVYPFHAWHQEPRTGGSHDDYVRDLVDREGTDTTTVCLFHVEYDDPDVRGAYERVGFRVICHGYRTDRDFLSRQLAELASHRRVVTNRVATALWYGAAMGCEVEVYGVEMDVRDDEYRRRCYERDRAEWPELFAGPVPGTRAVELADHELGAGYVRAPAELIELLGWTPAHRVVGRPLAAASHAVMRSRERRR